MPSKLPPDQRKKVPGRSAVGHERQCTHVYKDTGDRCTRWCTVGLKVCRRHGGWTPASRAKSERYKRREEAKKLVKTFGLPRNIDPKDALLEEIHRTAGHVAWLAELVGSLDPTDLKQYTRQTGGLLFERPAVWLELYQSERAHLANITKHAITLGLAERQVRMAEEQGQMIVRVIRGVLQDLHLDAEQQAQVPQLVRRHLTAVAVEAVPNRMVAEQRALNGPPVIDAEEVED
jgi:hypothetical protein